VAIAMNKMFMDVRQRPAAEVPGCHREAARRADVAISRLSVKNEIPWDCIPRGKA
jgi:hypothetical protein